MANEFFGGKRKDFRFVRKRLFVWGGYLGLISEKISDKVDHRCQDPHRHSQPKHSLSILASIVVIRTNEKHFSCQIPVRLFRCMITNPSCNRDHWLSQDCEAFSVKHSPNVSNSIAEATFNHHHHHHQYNPYQGGRSCAGARVAPAEKFGLGRKF